MLTKKLAAAALGAALAVVLPPLTFACSHSDTHTDTEANADVVITGEATDEALDDLLGLTPKDDAFKKAMFTSPPTGAKLPSGTIPTFAWTFGSSPAGGTDGGLGQVGPRAPAFDLGPLFGERTAWAHGAPVNGAAYLVVFSVPADAKLLRVFTTDQHYTPDAAAWDKLKAAKATITATVETALFDTNKVTSDGGPYSGAPVTFEIVP